MGERRGMNNTHLKNRNRGLVLQLIACEGPLPRVEIARRVGLTKMAVSNIVSELIAEGYVEECGTAEASAAVGRSPTLLRIASGAPGAIGVYLSRDSLSVILADMTCRILLKHTVSLAGETRESLTQKLLAAVAQVRQASPIPLLGIGISTIGPLDAANRLMLKPLRFFGISHYPIAAILEESSGLPAYLENDMNAAALAERLYGVGRRLDHFLYIGLSDGVGAGHHLRRSPVPRPQRLCRRNRPQQHMLRRSPVRLRQPRLSGAVCQHTGHLRKTARLRRPVARAGGF